MPQSGQSHTSAPRRSHTNRSAAGSASIARLDYPRLLTVEAEPAVAMEFDDWDGGRLRVNREFAALLRANGLTTFAALMNFAGGTVVRQIGARATARITLMDGERRPEFYIKRHGPLSWKEYLKPFLRLTRPVHGARPEWEAILRFHAAGIPTMVPVALGECDGESLLVTQSLEDCQSLLDWVAEVCDAEPAGGGWTGARAAEARRLMERVAVIARRMHDAGLHHQDFYLNHLLLPRGGTAEQIKVIDLGRVRWQRNLSRRWILKDLAQLEYSARRLPAALRLRFLKLYLGRPFEPADRRLIRRVVRKSRWIDRHTRRNGL